MTAGKIDAMFVHPEFMGLGIGKRIMSYLESLAREAALSRLHLESSLNAAQFYRSCGFVGDEFAEYHSPRGISLECILMHKHL
ncbi:MAG TPA: GNAT family N-acetyltransferase [Gammaproteobacteria bacterium]|nr:GNAT family N-acetyltransferase [Gammaproteobacteria bacterium]